MLTIVIPVHNNEHSLLAFHDRLSSTLVKLQRPYEIVFVDDASTDRSFELMANLVPIDSHLHVVRLRRHFGYTAALSAGFHEARGTLVVTMEATLQHAPEDIPALVAQLDDGFDIANGWPGDARASLLFRFTGRLMLALTGINLREFSTTFKGYRAGVLDHVHLYGDLHRFLPMLAEFQGARSVEVPLHRTPASARSFHCGPGQTLAVVIDILTIRFLLHYFTRPMHFFGGFGLLGISCGGGVLGYRAARRLLGHVIEPKHGPIILAGAILLLSGFMLFAAGILGEMAMRTYFESQGRPIYNIRDILTRKPAEPAAGESTATE